jgi:hypothetical protein
MNGDPKPAPKWLLALQPPSEDDQGGGVSAPPLPSPEREKVVQRARKYLAKCDPCIDGQGGSAQAFKVACAMVHGFHLTQEEAFAVIWADYNSRCVGPWSEKEWRHHLKSAAEKGHYDDLLAEDKPTPPKPPCRTKSVRMSTVIARDVEWLWPGWLPLGKLVVLDGDPDLGKSTLLLDIAARTSTHGIMPIDVQGMTGGVVILSAEDDIDDTILPRLLAAGADLDRIECITEINGVPPVIPMHIPEIEECIQKLDARLLIVDPLTAYLAADTRSDQEVRKALHPLKLMARRRRCVVSYLRHLNKGTGTRAMYRGGGSIAIIGAARSGLLVAADPDDPNSRILAHTKHNLTKKQPSLRYALEMASEWKQCRVRWIGSAPYSADDLLKLTDDDVKDRHEEERSKLEVACTWLQDFVSEPRAVKHCHAEAAKLNIARRTLERAAKKLGLTFKKVEGEWVWQKALQ